MWQDAAVHSGDRRYAFRFRGPSEGRTDEPGCYTDEEKGREGRNQTGGERGERERGEKKREEGARRREGGKSDDGNGNVQAARPWINRFCNLNAPARPPINTNGPSTQQDGEAVDDGGR